MYGHDIYEKSTIKYTHATRQIAQRLADQLNMRNPESYIPTLPETLCAKPVDRPIEEEITAIEASVLTQAKDRGLKGTAHALEQRASQEELKKRVLQFYCKHQYVNVPVQWYGATVYPRICARCGKIRDDHEQ